MRKMKYLFSLLIVLGCFGNVSAQENLAAHFSTDDTLGCLPFSATFTNQSIDAISYSWDFGDGNTSTLSSPVNTYTAPGNYTVKLLAICHNGEVDSIVLHNRILVLDTPSVSFSYSSDTLCPTIDTITFVNSTTAAASYLWDFGDGNISSLHSPKHVYQQQGSYNVSLIAYNAMGCAKSSTGDSPIIVHQKPVGTITSSLNLVCDTNSMVSYTSNGSGITETYWDFDDKMHGVGQTSNHVYTEEGIYNVSAIIVDSNNCETTVFLPQNITVIQSLTPEITISDSSGCPPLNIVFENVTPNAQNVVWTIEGNTFNSNNTTYTFTTPGTKSIQLGILDSNGCTTNTVFSDVLSVNDVPEALFSFSDSAGCAPLSTAIINQGNTTYTYNWGFSDGQQFSTYSPSVLFNDNQQIDLTVTISDPMGCDAIIEFDNIIDVQSATADISMDQYTGCEPLSVSFFEEGINATQWIWSFGDGVTSSAQNPVHVYSSAGVYSVQLITYNDGGCVDTVMLKDTIIVHAPQYNYVTPDTIFSCNTVIGYFDGTSIGQSSWVWDFGDGTSSTNSTETHTYSISGDYEVSLTTFDANGCEFTIPNYTTYSVAFGDIGFEFSMECDLGLVSFTDTSTYGTEWTWDFGDGVIDTIQNPIHQYGDLGIYLVQLTVTEGGCSQVVNSMVSSAFCEDNSSSPAVGDPIETESDTLVINLETGSDSINLYCAPYTINFTAPFDSLVSILWDFGDSTTSTLFDPSHTYTQAGVYDLNITIVTVDTTYILSSLEYLWLTGIVEDYTTEQMNLCDSGAYVSFFVDSLIGGTYIWNFGDGSQSTIENPIHHYTNSGNYLSSLDVVSSYGCTSTIVKPMVVNTPNPFFTYTPIICIDEVGEFASTINNYDSYVWDFGDGNSETGQNVSHAYSAAGTYWVTLFAVDSSGCADTTILPDPIQVNDPVAGFSFSDSVGCDALDVPFTNTSQYSDSWQWIFGNGNESTDIEPTNLFDSIGVFDVTLIATLGSCADTMDVPFAITIHESIKSAFTYTKQNSCYPVTLEFQNLTPSYTSLSWDFGDGNSTTLSNPVHTFYSEDATEITLSVIDSNQCETSVTHYGEPSYQSDFEITSLEGCVPVYASFSNLSDSAISWLWNFGNGDTSSIANPSYVYSDTGSYQVSLISSSTEGCIDTVVGDQLITVNYLSVDFSVPDSASCAPMATSFIDITGNATNWMWSFGDGAFSTLQNPSHIYLEPGDYTIMLVAGRDSTCFDTIVKVDFLQVLGPKAAYVMSDTVGCDSLGVQYTNQSTSYTQTEWFFGDGAFSTDTDVYHVYGDTGSFSGSLVVYDDNGCTDFEVINTIDIHASPMALFTPSVTSGCVPLTVSFDNSSLNNDSSNWSFGYGFNSTIESPHYTYNIPGTYYVGLYTENVLGCSSILDSIQIQVNPVPAINFEFDTSNHCFPAEIQFTNLSTDTGNTSFFWNFYNGIISQEVSPTVTFTDAGEYSVMLVATNQYNCTSSLSKSNYVKLNDTTPPNPNAVFTASVNETGAIELQWEKSEELDFHSYNIYRSNPFDTIFNKIDSLLIRATTNREDVDVETSNYFYGYKVQPVDKCGNVAPYASLVEHRTILLSAESVGENTVQLNWTPYKGSEPKWYSIFREYNGEVEQIAQLPSTSSSYIDTSFKCHDQYSYAVVAEELDRSIYFSQSNIVGVEVINELMLSQSIKIVRSTVVEDEFVLTEWAQPTIYPETVTGYVLLRSTSADSGFEPIQQLPAYITQYSDYDTEVMEQSYYYQVEIENVCSQKLSSNISSSILLDQQSDGNRVILSWSTYKGWSEGVEKYIIEKQVNDGEWKVIREVPGTQQQATDIIYE